MIVFGIPFVGIVVSGVFGWIPSSSFQWAIPVAFVIWLIGFRRQWLRFNRFDCPSCGKSLTASENIENTPVTFTCDPCDTIWDTGCTYTRDAG